MLRWVCILDEDTKNRGKGIVGEFGPRACVSVFQSPWSLSPLHSGHCHRRHRRPDLWLLLWDHYNIGRCALGKSQNRAELKLITMCSVTFAQFPQSAPSSSMPQTVSFTVDDLQILNRETSWVVGCSRRSSRLDLQPRTVISAIQRTHSPPNAGITTLCILYLDFKSVFVEPDQHPFFTAITEHPFFFLYFVSLQQPNLQHSNERGAGGCLLFTR